MHATHILSKSSQSQYLTILDNPWSADDHNYSLKLSIGSCLSPNMVIWPIIQKQRMWTFHIYQFHRKYCLILVYDFPVVLPLGLSPFQKFMESADFWICYSMSLSHTIAVSLVASRCVDDERQQNMCSRKKLCEHPCVRVTAVDFLMKRHSAFIADLELELDGHFTLNHS